MVLFGDWCTPPWDNELEAFGLMIRLSSLDRLSVLRSIRDALANQRTHETAQMPLLYVSVFGGIDLMSCCGYWQETCAVPWNLLVKRRCSCDSSILAWC